MGLDASHAHADTGDLPAQAESPFQVAAQTLLDVEETQYYYNTTVSPSAPILEGITSLPFATTGGDGEACTSAQAGKAVMNFHEPEP